MRQMDIEMLCIRDGNIELLFNEDLLFDVMIQGYTGALEIVKKMASDDDITHSLNIVFLDLLNIRGKRLAKLYCDCSGKDYDKFILTVEMIKRGVFELEDISTNLDLNCAISFIDDALIVNGVQKYNERIDFSSKNWKKFCDVQRKMFEDRLSECLKNSEDIRVRK